MDFSSFYKGSLHTILLRLIAQKGQMYGYEIIQVLKATSNEQLMLKEAALYPALHKMENQGLLLSEMRKIDGRYRKYYRLSAKGKLKASEQQKALGAYIHFLLNLI